MKKLKSILAVIIMFFTIGLLSIGCGGEQEEPAQYPEQQPGQPLPPPHDNPNR